MVRRTGSIKLVTLMGIRVGVDVSWFVILFLIIFTLSGSFQLVLDSSDSTAYICAVASALLLFASFIAHEFGHAIVARRQGIEVTGIDLFLFGGLTKMSRESRTAGEEFKVAAAGPAATFAVIVVTLGVVLAMVGPSKFIDAALLRENVHITPVLLVLTWVVNMNILLFVFNLIPAFPLDGGRIARAAVWRWSGDRAKGTRVSAALGQGFAYLLGGVGIWLLVSVSSWSGIWLLFLAFFLGQAARAATLQSAFTERLEGVRVADIMDTQPVSVPADLSVSRAHDEFFLRYRWSWFPVVDTVGRFVGLVRQEPIDEATEAGRGEAAVSSIMDSDAAPQWRVEEETPIESLLGSEPLRRFGALMAVDRDGILRGVVTIEQVRRALQAAVVPPAT